MFRARLASASLALCLLVPAPASTRQRMPPFRQPVADPREPFFRLKYEDYVEDRRYGADVADSASTGGWVRGHRGRYWDVAFGTRVPIGSLDAWKSAPELDGDRRTRIQFELPAALFAQFDREGASLRNADYQFGLGLDAARARFRPRRPGCDSIGVPDDGYDLDLRAPVWSARMQLFHRSTHLGDEYLSQGAFGVNQNGLGDFSQELHVPPVKRYNLSFQSVNAVASFESPPPIARLHDGVARLYAGVEKKIALGRQPGAFHSAIYQLGGEFWSSEAVPATPDTVHASTFDRAFGLLLHAFGRKGRRVGFVSEMVLGVDLKLAKPFDFASLDDPNGRVEVWTPHLWSEGTHGHEFAQYAGSWHAIAGYRFFLRRHRRDEYLQGPHAIVAWEWYHGYSPNGQLLDERLRYGPARGWEPTVTVQF